MDKKTLRKLQLVQLEIAKEIKRVCEENNISYFLDSGTLLGAVRHGGFIPWDDDLDMGMIRKDYDIFLKIAPFKLQKQYEIVTWFNNDSYPHAFAKVMKKGTICKEQKASKSKFNEGIYVDIFPYDRYPIDLKSQLVLNQKLTLYRGIIRVKNGYYTWYKEDGIDWKRFVKNIPVRIISCISSRKKIVEKYEKIGRKYNKADFKYYYAQDIMKFGSTLIPKECFNDLIDIKFEDEIFKAPCNWNSYLREVYGDYMQLPPESERENKHLIDKLDFGK